MKKYDLIVIGGGPAGYVASIYAAQAGLKVACVDKRKNLGGTCLNVGCIPSKRLLYSSKIYQSIKDDYSKHGIEVKSSKLNLKKMMDGKEEAVHKLTEGIAFLFKKNKVDKITGFAKIKKNKIVQVKKSSFKAEKIILATGSKPVELKNIKIDEEYIISSTGALSLKKVPKSLAVIGAGYIGLELGSVWSRLGSEVTVIEYLDTIVPSMDFDISQNFFNELKKQGLNFKLSHELLSSKILSNKVELKIRDLNSNKIVTKKFDKVLLSIGREPSSSGMGLNEIGIKTDKNGKVLVNEFYETSLKGVYAIGDIISGPMLAHKASSEAQAVIDIIIGKKGQLNYNAIPSVVYTNPEVAWVGKNKKELDSLNVNYKIGKFNFSSNSRSKVNGNTKGEVKVYSDNKSKRILGAHIIGENAGEMIGEFVVAIELGATAEDLALICHAHPTLSESVKEASSISAYGLTVHS
tara:strand:+ start:7465 stop:8856 length:1392 start_codon:yes stop_codon:yes gene_type:complete